MDFQDWKRHVSSTLSLASDLFTVVRLEGGYLNSTIRLELLRDLPDFPESIPHLAGQRSLVLKHYPGYMYAWPEAQLSTARAAIEAKALRMMRDNALIREAFQEQGVSVPSLVHFDESNNVLWMEDFGPRSTMESGLEKLSTDVSSRLGKALAGLHIATMPMNKHLTVEPMAGPLALAEHEARMRNILKDELDVDGLMESLCMKHSPIIGLPHGDVRDDELCLGLGDIWPSSVLLLDDSSSPRLGIIDWEFFGPLHPASELATVTARLYISYLGQGLQEAFEDIARAFVCGYMEIFQESKHGSLVSRVSWSDRAAAAWARVLLNALVRAQGEDGNRWNAQMMGNIRSQAVRLLRRQVDDPILRLVCAIG
ncbi:kinase-like domain-containing protein [Kockovaella imperatae]|uniref:Kinase-like domain-containing protein n=1 Tax=Kockovaella imperatae TaxID=4999 RepID=A0A1Y1UJF9_9TREE|nr:kinase-like domain-containing protein [Kockovaella imperatae]ORX38188.1 kinase-like domain-containing protein [Kockovaella imperatae]